MKLVILFISFLGGSLAAQVNPVFLYEGYQLQLMDMSTLTQTVWHTDAVISNEDEKIKLFKAYFKPASYSSFKTFFLPGEWPDISMEEYQQWQNTIDIKRLLLQNIIQVQDQEGKEYLIYQYMMDDPAYSVYQSAEFKKTASGWKLLHQQNDKASDCLMMLGTIEIPKLKELISGASGQIHLESIPFSEYRTYKEKFNRKDLYHLIEELLVEKGVSKTDRELARTYFEYKDDAAFIESICKKYNLDDVVFMGEINQAAGMQIYNFSKRQND
jgi:hypothetical protein